MSEPELFTVFPDNTLSYDCATCGGKCCKFHGDFYLTREDIVHIAEHPQSTPNLFIDNLSDPNQWQASFVSPSGCWFLRDDHLCDVEVKLGTESKPLNCKLFPTNKFVQIDNVLFADVSFSCPLGIAAESKDTTTIISHASMEQSIAMIKEQEGSLAHHAFPRVKTGSSEFTQNLKSLFSRLQDFCSKSTAIDWIEIISAFSSLLPNSSRISKKDTQSYYEKAANLYDSSLPNDWSQNAKHNQVMLAFIPSLVFQYLVIDEILGGQKIDMQRATTNTLNKILGLRFSVEVADLYRSRLTTEALTQLARKPAIANLRLLNQSIRLASGNTQIKGPSHMQTVFSRAIACIEKKPGIKVTEMLKEANIEPNQMNNMLQLISDNEACFTLH